ncbi:MAG: universal stress protein [Myxococcota bacterium]
MSVAPLQRILVAVDFSSCSRKALAFAWQLAGQLGAQLEAVYVIQVDSGTTTTPSEAELSAAREELRRFVAGVVNTAPVKERVEVGDARERIVSVCDDEAFDAIVVGTHGRTGRARALAGSVAESVVRMASRPVVTVRETS